MDNLEHVCKIVCKLQGSVSVGFTVHFSDGNNISVVELCEMKRKCPRCSAHAKLQTLVFLTLTGGMWACKRHPV